MIKKITIFFILFLSLIFLKPIDIFAQTSAFISIVNPIRGSDFWDQKDQDIESAVLGQSEILKKFNLNASWLLRYDALANETVIKKLKSISSDEKGLFLEVTPSWAKDSAVTYHQGPSWHAAGSAFLTGYDLSQREQLIDVAFEKFKKIFDYYPQSVGAWWIDSHSLSYMQKKYGIETAVIVADQYTTDNYQIWGQYFSTPYYPAKNNALHPAQSLANKLPVVMVQWAARDPVNSYGNGVGESTYSVQANDYLDYHNLDTNYFTHLINLYTKQSLNKFSHVVVGLENSYSWKKYGREYENQIKNIDKMKQSGEIAVVRLTDFAAWYKSTFPNLSPEQIIVADDPLGSYKKAVWFMSPYYRAGWFLNQDGSVFRDIHQYVDGDEELCYKTRCDSVNFATSATRVLDEVSFGHKWIIDPGQIYNFKVYKEDEGYVISYLNEVGKQRTIDFLPRDISIDGIIQSIDGAILNATKKDLEKKQTTTQNLNFGFPDISFFSTSIKIFKFLLFLMVAVLMPGYVFINKLFTKSTPSLQKMFLSLVVGFTSLTVLFYIFSILHIKQTVYVYFILNCLLFIKFKLYKHLLISVKFKEQKNIKIFGLIIMGTIFQAIPVFQSGLKFPYGLGFWGPNTHDGVWHIALINQLVKNVPPQNPIFAGQILKNYHYFYDLLIATTNYLTQIPISDLIFRFFPIIFSLGLGIGTYYLIWEIFGQRLGIIKTKLSVIFSLYFIYFAGSFGWIVEFIKQRHLGGESAFWANQAVSFNLNPPFAISLVIIIALLQILPLLVKLTKTTLLVSILLMGSLISFKSYAALLVLITTFIVGVVELIRKKDFSLILISVLGSLLATILFLSNFEISKSLFIIAPLWFVNSMIDSPDRVGWERVTLMRTVGQTQKVWFKFITAEGISLILFIVGNLGLRILSFGMLIKFKNLFNSKILLFITIFSLLSAIIPIIFIQAGNPWNTIQFFYYYLYTASIFSGVVMSWLIFKMPKLIGYVLIGLILLFTPINSVVTARGYLSTQPHAYISQKELQALQYLANQPDGVVLTFPYDNDLKKRISEPWPLFVYDSTAYVSAFSNKQTFIEDEPQNQILLTDYKIRTIESKDFFSNLENKKFLQDNKISYIYLPKLLGVRIEEKEGYMSKILEDDETLVYKVQ